MANFTWTNAAGGDWSVASNWSPFGVIPAPPPGNGDNADFGDLASSDYTVTVQAGTKVGWRLDGPFIVDRCRLVGLDGHVAFSISGSLTADFHYVTSRAGLPPA